MRHPTFLRPRPGRDFDHQVYCSARSFEVLAGTRQRSRGWSIHAETTGSSSGRKAGNSSGSRRQFLRSISLVCGTFQSPQMIDFGGPPFFPKLVQRIDCSVSMEAELDRQSLRASLDPKGTIRAIRLPQGRRTGLEVAALGRRSSVMPMAGDQGRLRAFFFFFFFVSFFFFFYSGIDAVRGCPFSRF